MTGPDYYTHVLARWGEDWRPCLKAFLAEHEMTYTRQAFWYWRRQKRRVPDKVATLLMEETNNQQKERT